MISSALLAPLVRRPAWKKCWSGNPRNHWRPRLMWGNLLIKGHLALLNAVTYLAPTLCPNYVSVATAEVAVNKYVTCCCYKHKTSRSNVKKTSKFNVVDTLVQGLGCARTRTLWLLLVRASNLGCGWLSGQNHRLIWVPVGVEHRVRLGTIVWNHRSTASGITPIGQGWTNARGLRGLGCPKPDPNFFVYFNISSVRCQPSILLYSWLFVNVLRPSSFRDLTSHFIIVLCLTVILVCTLIMINSSVNSKWGMRPFM